MKVYSTLARWAGTQPWFSWLGRRVLTPLDSHGRAGKPPLSTIGTGLPAGYLTAVGRRSGRPRTVPLLFVETSTGAPAVVGTNFGSEHHPSWVGNLLAEPHATWRADDARPVRARQVDGAEYAELWGEFVAMWPGYEMYAKRSGRRPVMFVLDATGLDT